MAREKWYPTNKELKLIEEMTKKGSSQKAIYTALGISQGLWYKYKRERENEQNAPSIKKTIEQGNEERAHNHLSLAQDALALRLQQRVVKETTTVSKTIGGEDYAETKEVEKVIQPSDTLIMFTLVNRSEGEWQSINKVDTTVINNNDTPSVPVSITFTKPKVKND